MVATTLRAYQKPTLTRAAQLGAIIASISDAPSDRRLKRDISLIGRRADGIGVYSYRYVVGETRYIGVMAQEVCAVRPDAVHANADGFLMVDYDRLGMTLQRVA